MNTAIQHFSMHFTSEQGEVSYPFSIKIEPDQRSIKLALHTIRKGELFVGVKRGGTAALAAREALGNAVCRDGEMWDLPAEREVGKNYLSERRTIIERCLPSIGTQATSLTINGALCSDDEHIQGIDFIPAQEIVDRAFRGDPVSFNLMLSVLSLALDCELPLKLPVIPTTETMGGIYAAVDREQITKEELEAWRADAGRKTSLSLIPAAAPEKPFIKGIFVHDAEQETPIEIAYRKGSDAVDIGAYVWHRGRIYIPVKIGSRPAKALMDEFREFQFPWCDIDGVAGSVEPHETANDLQMRALVETEEELGMLAASAPQRVGSFFSLPQSATEMVTSFLCEINPDTVSHRTQGADETVSLRFMELDSFLDSFKAGIVQDGRLVLSALLIKQAFHYHNPLLEEISGLQGTIAIFGGTFDPLQSAHMSLAAAALEDGNADSVLMIPAKQNRFKRWKPMLDDDARLGALLASTSSHAGMYVSDIELKGDAPYSITADTIARLKAKNPEAKLLFVMGSDLLTTLHQWHRVDQLFSLLDGVLVYERDGFSREDFSTIEDLLSEEIIKKLKSGWQGSGIMPHSSSDIRKSLDAGRLREVEAKVPPAVFGYLKFLNKH